MIIMIVEDNKSMRSYLSGLIREEGDTVIECSDGKYAGDMYAKYHPDWVLMDIKMKKVNGIKATRNIIKSFPSARIVMLTSYDTPEYRKASLDAGALNFLCKRDLRLLWKTIERK